MDFDELIDVKMFDLLNGIKDKEDYSTAPRTINLSNELLETLKIVKDCTSCKDKIKRNKSKKKRLIYGLDGKLTEMDFRLNKWILCRICKRKKIEKLTDKYGNKEIARLLHDTKLNTNEHVGYVQWIPFDEFRNIEYLAKGDFSEVHRATWSGCSDCYYYY